MNYQQELKQAGYKLTDSRQRVLDYLKKRSQPVSVEHIYQSLKKQLDKVTVYRILEVFEGIGLVHREQTESKALYYLSEKEHHHIVCRQCGRIECLPCDHLFSNIKNFTQVRHQLTLTGLCSECSR